MKRYIQRYSDFLNEVLTPTEAKKYGSIRVVGSAKSIQDKIFGNAEKIFIPFDVSKFEGYVEDEKSKVQIQVEELLTSKGVEIISYLENKCKKVDDNNITKIGKMLVNPRYGNNKQLAEAYALDISKSRNVEKSKDDMYIIISRNKVDIAGMSTDRSWTSCQNIRNGMYRKYVAKDIAQGSFVAYLTKATDTEILDPEARILIKPFINVNDSNDIVFLPCSASYYRGKNIMSGAVEKYPLFGPLLMSWAKSIQPNLGGTYQMQKDVYQDGRTRMRVLSNEEQEKVDNPQTVDDWRIIAEYYSVNIRPQAFTIREDGLIEYNEGSISFYGDITLTEPPKFLKMFATLGNLEFENCSNLKSFENLENLERVEFAFNINSTKIKYFNELKKLKYIGTLYCHHTNIENFRGLESVERIGYIKMQDCKKFKSFNGLEKCDVLGIFPKSRYEDYFKIKPELQERLEKVKSIEDFQYVSNFYGLNLNILQVELDENNLITYNGHIRVSNDIADVKLPKIFKYIKAINGDLDLGSINLQSLENLENLETIKGELSIRSTKGIRNFKGLSKLKYVKDINCAWSSIETFEGLDSLEKIQYINIDNCDKLKGIEDIFDVEIQSIFPKKYFREYVGSKPENKERLENPKTIEDFYFMFHYYGLGIYKDKMKLENGLVVYDGSLKVSKYGDTDANITSALKYLYKVNGTLDVEGFAEVKDLSFLKNLEYVEDLDINLHSIETLEGLDNLKSIGTLQLRYNSRNLKNLKGLTNCKHIEKIYVNDISMEGLENIDVFTIIPSIKFQEYLAINTEVREKIENPRTKAKIAESFSRYGMYSVYLQEDGNFVKYNDSIKYRELGITEAPKFFKHLSHIEILNVSNSNISLRNLHNLKSIGNFSIGNANIQDFKRLKSLKRIDVLDISNSENVKSFEGLENVDIGSIHPVFNSYKIYELNPTKMEEINNPKSVDEFSKSCKIYGITAYDVTMNDNGKFSVRNLVFDVRIKKIPEFIKYVENVSKIDMDDCKNITSLEMLSNIKSMDILRVSGTSIKNFKGIENIGKLNNLVMKGCDNLKGFGGLENVEVENIEPENRKQEFLIFKNPDIMKSVKNPKTENDWKEFAKYTGLDFEKIEILDNGLLKYDGYITINDCVKAPEWLSKFQEGKHIQFYYCRSLENIESLRNLKVVTESLTIDGTKIKDLKGLEKLERVGGSILLYDCKDLSSLESLKNLEYVGGTFNISGTSVESFNGLQNLEIIGDVLKFSDTKINNFNGLDKLTKVDSIYCQNTNIKNFEGLEKLTTLSRLDCSGSSIVNFKGLDNVTGSAGRYTSSLYIEVANCKKLKSFTGLENAKCFFGNSKRQDAYETWKNSL